MDFPKNVSTNFYNIFLNISTIVTKNIFSNVINLMYDKVPLHHMVK